MHFVQNIAPVNDDKMEVTFASILLYGLAYNS
jgi:hypothetical protein